jgi:hypothetical protein
MANCNNCGCYIPTSERVLKREMYSGTSQRTNYGKRISFGTSRYYSMKSVCENCARQIDQSNAEQNKTIMVVLMVLGIIIALYFLLK